MKEEKKKRLSLQEVLSGEIFTKDFVRKQYKFLLVIAGLFMVYIHNGFRGQEEQREIQRLQNELIVANAILSDLSREYTSKTRPSYLNEQLQKNGSKVKESRTPAILIK